MVKRGTATKQPALTEEQHYQLVDEKLAALMNAIPETKNTRGQKVELPAAPTVEASPTQEPKKVSAWATRASEYYWSQKAKRPELTYKQALIELKAAK
jgi:hypothetical protein